MTKLKYLLVIRRFRVVYIGRLPFDHRFQDDKWYENFLGKVSEKPEIVEFPKSEPFNRKFWKFRDENQLEQKFPRTNVQKSGYTSRGCLFFGIYANWQFARTNIRACFCPIWSLLCFIIFQIFFAIRARFWKFGNIMEYPTSGHLNVHDLHDIAPIVPDSPASADRETLPQ